MEVRGCGAGFASKRVGARALVLAGSKICGIPCLGRIRQVSEEDGHRHPQTAAASGNDAHCLGLGKTCLKFVARHCMCLGSGEADPECN